eukprot:516435_1
MNSTIWTQLTLPFDALHFPPIQLNPHELLLITTNKLYKYNSNGVVSLLLESEQLSFPMLQHKSMTHDVDNHLIFLINQTQLTKINYKKNKIETNYLKHSVSRLSEIIYLQNKLHIFYGPYNNKHMIYNFHTKESHTIHTFKKSNSSYRKGLNGFGLIRLPSQNKILVIGGTYEQYNRKITNNEINSYCMKTNQWTQLNLRLPYQYKFGSICSTLTTDEKHCILVGGKIEQQYKNWIFVIDIEAMTIRKSSIDCPIYSHYYASTCNMKNKTKDEITVFGYIRDVWKQFENRISIVVPPYYIIKLMEKK